MRHKSAWFVGTFLLIIVVCQFLFIHTPIALDSVMARGVLRWPYFLRLPLTVVLIAFVVAGWWRDQVHIPVLSREPWKRILESRLIFFALVILTFFCYREFTFGGYEFDFDESQSIVTARTLLKDPRFWISVDIGTHGPFVSLPQAALPYFGIAIDYAGSRLLGMMMMVGGVLALFFVLRRIATESTARLLLLPLLFLIAALELGDLVAYNGEHPILLFTMLSMAAVVSGLLPAGEGQDAASTPSVPLSRAIWYLFLGGVALGTVPWMKLQGVPFVLFQALLAVCGCFIAPLPPGAAVLKWRVLRALSFLVGLVFPTIAVLVWIIADGAFLLMVKSYIIANIGYANRNNESLSHTVVRLTPWLRAFLIGSTSFHEALCPLMWIGVVAVVFMVWLRRHWSLAEGFALISLLWLAVASLCILRPGNDYDHYLLLAIFPLGLFSLSIWASLMRKGSESGLIPRLVSSRNLGIVFIVLGLVYPLCAWGGDWSFFVGSDGHGARFLLPFRTVASRYTSSQPIHDTLSAVLKQVVHPNEYIAIWGFRPNLFVSTNTLSATRSAVSVREAISEHPEQPYFYQLYLNDLDVNRPVAFVDNIHDRDNIYVMYKVMRTINPKLPLRDETSFVHEKFPGLSARIQKGYHLFFTDKNGARIYLRNDRYAAVVGNHGRPVP